MISFNFRLVAQCRPIGYLKDNCKFEVDIRNIRAALWQEKNAYNNRSHYNNTTLEFFTKRGEKSSFMNIFNNNFAIETEQNIMPTF